MNMSFFMIRYHAFCLFGLNQNKENMCQKIRELSIHTGSIFYDCNNSPTYFSDRYLQEQQYSRFFTYNHSNFSCDMLRRLFIGSLRADKQITTENVSTLPCHFSTSKTTSFILHPPQSGWFGLLLLQKTGEYLHATSVRQLLLRREDWHALLYMNYVQ